MSPENVKLLFGLLGLIIGAISTFVLTKVHIKKLNAEIAKATAETEKTNIELENIKRPITSLKGSSGEKNVTLKKFWDIGIENIHEHLTDDNIRSRLEKSRYIRVLKTWFPENDQIEEGLLSAVKNGAKIELLLCKPNSHILQKRCEAANEEKGPYWIYRAIDKIYESMEATGNRNIKVTLYDGWPGCPVIWYGDNSFYDSIVMGFYFWGKSSPRWPWIDVNTKLRSRPSLFYTLDQQFKSISKIEGNQVLDELEVMKVWLRENREYDWKRGENE